MKDNINLSPEQLNALLNKVSGSTGASKNEIMEAMNSGNLEDLVMKTLKPSQANKLQSILKDKKAADELLSSPQARQLLKKLLGEK